MGSIRSSRGSKSSGPNARAGGDSAPSEPSATPGESKQPPDARGAPLAPGLYLVATPIGNARDITLRALDVLAAAAVVACEDTRVTARLLAIHGIATPLTPYHEHNADKARPALIRRLKSGESVALVSDAGTPLVSDPGHKLVRACVDDGIPVVPVPGASAVLAALQVSALPSDRFLFAGFPPAKGAARRRALAEVAAVPATLVFLESAKRLAASLADMAEVLGDRPAAVGRELTKLFEETRRGSLAALAAHYADAGPPRGEVTVVVGPPVAAEVTDEEVDRLLTRALADQSLRDAADAVAAATGRPRRAVYNRALDLKG
ncbi:MAG: 16S rRNA (cytidine(1402)-2'-O)-methyltransferase [Hyphomicrobiales bacterium]|nr:16S rRNA (cytidine(1402)-2'-O)-methyltransferase [Hyphomicrobiales bacterium]MCP5370389.1 16S rRNA (cytidine(1402)-2'-O)-methyltransferase [Hyphomicrobiales bacterium]